jgi:5-methyltetrahydrofolate--homocysteine methyltransferase
MNPLHDEDLQAVMGADVMMGHDPNGARWVRRFREALPAGAEGEERRGRRESRRRRPAAG